MNNPWAPIILSIFAVILFLIVPGMLVGAIWPAATIYVVPISVLVALVCLGNQKRFNKTAMGGIEVLNFIGMGLLAFAFGDALTGWIF